MEPLADIYRQPEYPETMPPTEAAEQVAHWRRQRGEDGFAPWAACRRGLARARACLYLLGREAA